MNDVLVEARNCTKVYDRGNVTAFEDLSFEIRRNEIVTIVGPSGCGKTTLLRCLDGLIPLTSGEVRMDGVAVTKPDPRISMVFQHFGLLPWHTVEANVGFGLRMQGMAKAEWREIANHYVDLVGLAGFERAYPFHLSGGMRQRVGLARALAMRPKVLLMDEPFASVDAQTREDLQSELLNIWAEERPTMVFITHSIDEAILLGHRIFVLGGRPTNTKEVLEVPFEMPRDLDEVRLDPRFNELRHHVWERLRRKGPRVRAKGSRHRVDESVVAAD